MNQLTTESVSAMLEPHASIHGDQNAEALGHVSLRPTNNAVLQLSAIGSQERPDQGYLLSQQPQKSNAGTLGNDMNLHNHLLRLPEQDPLVKLGGGHHQYANFDIIPDQMAAKLKKDVHAPQSKDRLGQHRQPATQIIPPDNNHEIYGNTQQKNMYLNDNPHLGSAGEDLMKLAPGMIQPGAVSEDALKDEKIHYKNLRQNQVMHGIPDATNLSNPEFAMELVYSQFLFPYEKHQIRTLGSFISGQKNDFPASLAARNQHPADGTCEEDGASGDHPPLQKRNFPPEEIQSQPSDVYYDPPQPQQQRPQINDHPHYYPQLIQDQNCPDQKISLDNVRSNRVRNSFMVLEQPPQSYRKYSLQHTYPYEQLPHCQELWNTQASPAQLLDKNINHELNVSPDSNTGTGAWMRQAQGAVHHPSAPLINPSQSFLDNNSHAYALGASAYQPPSSSVPLQQQQQGFYGQNNQLFVHDEIHPELLPVSRMTMPTNREVRRSSVNIPMNNHVHARRQSVFPAGYTPNGKYVHPASKAPDIYNSSSFYAPNTQKARAATQNFASTRRNTVYANPSVGSPTCQNAPMHLVSYPKPLKPVIDPPIPKDVALGLSSNSPRNAESDTDQDNIDFDDVTVVALKQHLRKRGLPSFGKKSQLVERLKSDLEVVKKQQQVGKGANISVNKAQEQLQQQLATEDVAPAATGTHVSQSPRNNNNHNMSSLSVPDAYAPLMALQLQQQNILHQQQPFGNIDGHQFSTPDNTAMHVDTKSLQANNATASIAPSIFELGPDKESQYSAEVQALLDKSNKPFDVSDFVYQDLNEYLTSQCDPPYVFKTA